MNQEPDNILTEIADDPAFKEQLKKLVLQRMGVMPDTMRIAIGSTDFDKKDLIDRVEEGDEIGNQLMAMELEFLRDLASGAVYQET